MNRFRRAATSVVVLASALLCSLALADFGGVQALDKATASQLGDPKSHKQPTVVALWSLDCPHCKAYLQQLGDLARTESGVKIITVAVEPREPKHGRALDEVRSEGARYAYGEELPDALGYALDSSWHGELPRALFFNGKGEGIARSGRLSMHSVRVLLELDKFGDNDPLESEAQ